MRQRETEGEKIHRMPKEGSSARECNSIPRHVPYTPWNSPGQNTRVGSHSLLQGNLPTSGMEPMSPTLQADSLPAESPGKPISLVKDTCTPMFTAALSTTAGTWKLSSCPSTSEWVKKKWDVHMMEYYSAMKKIQNWIFPRDVDGPRD